MPAGDHTPFLIKVQAADAFCFKLRILFGKLPLLFGTPRILFSKLPLILLHVNIILAFSLNCIYRRFLVLMSRFRAGCLG